MKSRTTLQQPGRSARSTSSFACVRTQIRPRQEWGAGCLAQTVVSVGSELLILVGQCPYPPSRYLCFRELVILLGNHPFGFAVVPRRSVLHVSCTPRKEKGALTGVPPRTRQFRRPEKRYLSWGSFDVLTAQWSMNVVGVYQLGREKGWHGPQTKRDRRLEKLAMDVLSALSAAAHCWR
jgi:hypothetical protein